MCRSILTAAALLLGITTSAQSATQIIVGDHFLFANTPNQAIDIFVIGDDAVQDFLLSAQIADGGPLAGGSVLGPAISSADIITGTIFDGNNVGQIDLDPTRDLGFQIFFTQTSTASDHVAPLGLLARLFIDTTGFQAGAMGDLGLNTWSLRLADTVVGSSSFGEITPEILAGSVYLFVPEPSSLTLLGLAAMSVAIYARRTRKTRMRVC